MTIKIKKSPHEENDWTFDFTELFKKDKARLLPRQLKISMYDSKNGKDVSDIMLDKTKQKNTRKKVVFWLRGGEVGHKYFFRIEGQGMGKTSIINFDEEMEILIEEK